MKQKMKDLLKIVILNLAIVNIVNAQGTEKKFKVEGTIIDKTTGKPVEFGSLGVVETREKFRIDSNGKYSIELQQGTWTILVTSPGLGTYRETLEVNENIVKNIELDLPKAKGAGMTISADKEKQKVARYNITKDEMKSVPATMGDSVGALGALAGIERMGLLGPLVIRGMPLMYNYFYVDGVVLPIPQHFMGLHSVIHNEFMTEIDVYSSNMPARFYDPLNGAIEISTIDSVDEFHGSFDMGILSSNLFLASPIKNSKGENKGYVAVGGRYGYLSLIAPAMIKAATGDTQTIGINYYDYQFKAGYFLTAHHKLSLMILGMSDMLDLSVADKGKSLDQQIKDGADPLMAGSSISLNSYMHSQIIRSEYLPSEKFSNRITASSQFIGYVTKFDFSNSSSATWAKGININSNPDIFSVKDDIRWAYLPGFLTLKAGASIDYYDFTASGKGVVPNGQQNSLGGTPDPADPNAFIVYNIDMKTDNSVVSAFGENSFTWNGLDFTPGLRYSYLTGHELSALDPRARLSYQMPTDTTIAVAVGQNSAFMQTNFTYFSQGPEVSESDLIPERALQRTAAIEQRFLENYSVKMEGYYNTFDNLVELGQVVVNGVSVPASTRGERKSYGAEITVKKEQLGLEKELYGWITYAYGRNFHKTNLPASIDPYGTEWINGEFDRRHAVKVVSGFRFGKNNLGAKFQYLSAVPVTPIIGNSPVMQVTVNGIVYDRYSPVHGKRYSKFLPADHRLDLRYSRTSRYTWGSIEWYIELINVYNYKSKSTESWKYNKPYSAGVNPALGTPGAAVMPNFGVEVKF